MRRDKKSLRLGVDVLAQSWPYCAAWPYITASSMKPLRCILVLGVHKGPWEENSGAPLLITGLLRWLGLILFYLLKLSKFKPFFFSYGKQKSKLVYDFTQLTILPSVESIRVTFSGGNYFRITPTALETVPCILITQHAQVWSNFARVVGHRGCLSEELGSSLRDSEDRQQNVLSTPQNIHQGLRTPTKAANSLCHFLNDPELFFSKLIFIEGEDGLMLDFSLIWTQTAGDTFISTR